MERGSMGNDILHVSTDTAGSIVVRGELDISAGPILDDAIRDVSDPGSMTLDLADVTFIDSSGLRSLLNASRRAQAGGGMVRLRGVGPEVQRLLEITGTTDRFHIERRT